MKKSVYALLIFILAVIINVSFFLPWLSIESKPIGSISKLLTGKSQTHIDTLNGFKIPIRANSSDARFMISVVKIFHPGMKNIPKNSFYIWLLPLIAVISFGASYFFRRTRLVALLIAIAGFSIFSIGFYKITHTDLERLILTVRIGSGLWLTLYAYLAMGIIGASRFIQLSLRARRKHRQALKEKERGWQIKTVKVRQ